jgi:predicted dienelactone hydrolase
MGDGGHRRALRYLLRTLYRTPYAINASRLFMYASLSTRALRAWCLVMLLFAVSASCAFAQGTSGVGFHAIRIHDPVNGGEMPGYVFYPAKQATGMTWVGPYHIAGIADAPMAPGVRPLVVLSHGNGGSDLGHHDIATYLAAHGFIVATLEHPKDNFHDTSGVGYAPVLGGRPIQVKATISRLLDDPTWKASIDASRIGVAGFSAGGYTSLLVVGAKPTFSRFIDYCHRYPGDDTCASVKPFTTRAAAAGLTVPQMMARIQKDSTQWGDTADPRVKAAFVMAPLSLVFDKAGAASIDRPVFLYYGQNDHVLRPSENAEHLRPLMHTLVGVKMVPKADHWVFIPPCSPGMAKEVPVLCSDPAGVDRAKVHAQIQIDALAFFRKTLHVPAN